MEVCDSNQDLINSEFPKNMKSLSSSKDNNVLCKHCKRTATNGIRCLGMCVADNDY